MKLKVLMIMLHRVNHLNIRQKKHEKLQPSQPVNEGDADQPARPPVPYLDVEFTIQLEYLRNF